MLCTEGEFLAGLKALYDGKRGTVFLTLKRGARCHSRHLCPARVCAASSRTHYLPRPPPPPPVVPRTGAPHCLFRATDGKRQKLSVRVAADGAARFHPLCMSVIKGSTSALKKVEKKKAAVAAKK